MLKLVPFDAQWVSAQGESGAPLLDIHAIYRRPSVDRETGEKNRDTHGFIIWDETGGLPVQSHGRWTRRGFKYVTLSDRASLIAVSKPELGERGVTPLDDGPSYIVRRTNSPWHGSQYAIDKAAAIVAQVDQIQADVGELGEERAQELARGRLGDQDYLIPVDFVEAGTAPENRWGEEFTPNQKQALSRAQRKVDQGKPLTELEQSLWDLRQPTEQPAEA